MTLVMKVLRLRFQDREGGFGSLEIDGILGLDKEANLVRENLHNMVNHDDLDGDLDSIKLKIPNF